MPEAPFVCKAFTPAGKPSSAAVCFGQMIVIDNAEVAVCRVLCKGSDGYALVWDTERQLTRVSLSKLDGSFEGLPVSRERVYNVTKQISVWLA